LNVSVSDGNCGGLDAVACATVFLEQERADALLVGGAEAMTEALVLGFDRLGTTSSSASLGEGAALVALETPAAAAARGADVRSWVVGYGTAFVPPQGDASLLVASSEAVERSIVAALADAGILPGEVDLVVSGVSGLRAFDDAELLGIDRALRPDVCVVAPKLALGETLGAGGAMAILVAMAHLRGETRSYVVRGALRSEARTALVTSIGYYGNASALVMRAPSR
jgi:3-oxoacyl-(acyl-carrier-protein) synthase